MKKTSGVLTVFLFLFSMGHFFFAQGEPAEKSRLAPLNPEFLKYQALIKTGKAQQYSDDWHPLGRVPAPVNLSHVRGDANRNLAASYPHLMTCVPTTRSRMCGIRDRAAPAGPSRYGVYGIGA